MHSKLLIFLSAILLALSPETGFAGDLHADAGVTSDYVWRGLSQTRGGPAVSGELEYVTVSDWYFGTWVSNTSQGENGVDSAEVDYYLGLSGKGSTVGYDVGIINYTYPQSSGLDFSELYFSLMLEGYSFKYFNGADSGTYLEANMTRKLTIRKESSLVFHIGNYNRKSGSDYFDYSVSLRISEFSLTFSKARVSTAQDKDLKTFVSWEQSF